MIEVAAIALGAFGMIGGGVAVALALCWLTFHLGETTRSLGTCTILAGVFAVLTLADVFSCGEFPRVSAAFSLPMLLFLWDSARTGYQGPKTVSQG